MKKDFFPEKPDNNPKIYAYTENTPEYKDLIKIGYTARSLDERMKEHYPTKGPNNIKSKTWNTTVENGKQLLERAGHQTERRAAHPAHEPGPPRADANPAEPATDATAAYLVGEEQAGDGGAAAPGVTNVIIFIFEFIK